MINRVDQIANVSEDTEEVDAKHVSRKFLLIILKKLLNKIFCHRFTRNLLF